MKTPWPIQTLGELCEVRIGRTPSRDNPAFWGGSAVWVSISELTGGVISKSREHPSDLAVAEIMPEPIASGTLLFSFKLSIGKMGIAGVPLYTNEAIAALPILNEKVISREFLKYALARCSHEGTAENAVMGKVLNKAKVCALPIPVPPLPEQRRIVALLDQAENLRSLRHQADRRTADLIPALFHNMFGTRSAAKQIPLVQLGQLVKFVGGGTPSRARAEYFEGKIPWATSKDIKSDYITDTQEHVTKEGVADSSTNIVPAASVLIVVKSKILMHSLPVAITSVPLCFGQDLKALVCNGEVLPEFIASALRTNKNAILSQARGANTEGLTLDILRAVKIPLPPLPLQKQFAAAVADIRAMQQQQAASKKRLGDLFHSLLHRAFRGEL